MLERISIAVSVLLATIAMASAFDQTKYPDLTGQWRRGPNTGPAMEVRGRANVFDPSKGWGPAQQPPLTPEYQARYEANLADQAAGGQGIVETYACVSPGRPRDAGVGLDNALAARGLVGEVGLVAGLVFGRQRRLLGRPPAFARIKHIGAAAHLHRRAGVRPAPPLAREIGVFGLVECGSHGDGRQQHRHSDR